MNPEGSAGTGPAVGQAAGPADAVITVSGNPWLAGVLALSSAGVAVGYGASVVALSLGLLAVVWLLVALDAWLPRLVMDRHGVRVRFARTWVGITWADFGEAMIRTRPGWWRDDLIVPTGVDPGDLAELGRWARWHAIWTSRCFGSAYAVPLGWATRVHGADGDLRATMIGLQAASGAGSPPRHRAPEADYLQRTKFELVDLADPAGEPTEVIALPNAQDAARSEPTIGPALAQARLRLALSVHQVAERTKIPGRVIEAIESDDFAASDGDFYARGQLRTLCRVLGVEVAPLLTAYDSELVAPEPVGRAALVAALSRQPAPSAGVRGRRWSVAVAIIMFLTLAWSMARVAQ